MAASNFIIRTWSENGIDYCQNNWYDENGILYYTSQPYQQKNIVKTILLRQINFLKKMVSELERLYNKL